MKQKIILFLFSLVFIAACKKSDDSETTPAATGNNISVTIDGQAKKFVSNSNGYSTFAFVNKSGTSAAYLSRTAKQNSGVDPNSITFSKGLMTLPSSGAKIADSTFFNYFNTGTYVYAGPSGNGVVVTYVDSDGKQWSTLLGSQGGGYFAINKKTTRFTTGKAYVDAQGDFSCKLYDSNGSFKTCTGSYFTVFANE
ncbi:MAG: hypothetical protein WC150_00710 [Bacteroidia bacterium]